MTPILLFDLDETLYPPEAGVMDCIRARIFLYLRSELHVPQVEANALRRSYLQEYGTTLRGLQINHHIDPEKYLRYVHDIPLERYLRANPELDAALADIPLTKVVFTNASREHAERVLGLLSIRRHFVRIIDVRDVEYESKPQKAAYDRACGLLGVRPQECVIVEDNVRNLRPAKALGMITILVGDGEGQPDGSVDVTIQRIELVGAALARLGLTGVDGPPQAGNGART